MTDFIIMDGVMEYGEEMPVRLGICAENKRVVIVAYNEAGYNSVEIDYAGLVHWVAQYGEAAVHTITAQDTPPSSR